jgi:hypothetical protein
MDTICRATLLFTALAAAALPCRIAIAGPLLSGQEIFEASCASCHGSDGRGQSKTQTGFALKILDLGDCRRTQREPDSDWAAVIREGGPARRFDATMPAFGDAMSEPEIETVIGYARDFCQRPSFPRGDLNLPRPLVTEKAFPEDELVVTSAVNAESPGAVASKIVYEQRVGPTTQIELVVPFTSAEGADGDWQTGIGDVVLGAKQVLAHSLRRGSILSIAGEVILPTGDSAKGFGKGTTCLEPFLAFGQILPGDAFVHVQTGAEIPVDGSPVEAFARLAGGVSFDTGRYGRSWSPMVELVGYRELEEGQKTHADVVPGMQVSLSRRKHILAMAGAKIPLDERSRPVQVMAYLLWDWFDGGLFEAW